MPGGKGPWALVLALVVVMGTLGALTARDGAIAWNYLTSVLLTILIYALFSLGLSLEFGFTGLVNFGHVAFMGLGAYTVAIAFERFQALDPSLSARLEGWTLAGAATSLLLALVAGGLAFVPLLHLASRWLPRRWGPRWRVLLAQGAGAVLGLAAFVAVFPLGPGAAVNAAVFLCLVGAVLVAALAGLALGLPAIRLREDYLAIVSIGAAEILRSVFVNEGWLTHGTLGIQRLQRPVVDWALTTRWWVDLSDRIGVQPVLLAHTVVAALLVAYAFMLLQMLARSPWGRVLRAIREDEDLARSLGKNVQAYKLQSLMLGSALAGLAGVLLVWHLSNVYPEHFLSLVTFFGFIIVILGGVGDHLGTLVGAVVLWGVFELARNLTVLSEWGVRDLAGPPQAIFIGLLLILVMLVRPQGILGRKEELLFAR